MFFFCTQTIGRRWISVILFRKKTETVWYIIMAKIKFKKKTYNFHSAEHIFPMIFERYTRHGRNDERHDYKRPSLNTTLSIGDLFPVLCASTTVHGAGTMGTKIGSENLFVLKYSKTVCFTDWNRFGIDGNFWFFFFFKSRSLRAYV